MASAAKVSVEFEKKEETELLSLDSAAKSILLKTDSGFVTQHNAIIRFIAELDSSLLGSSEIERAQVDQWLDFSWQDLG